MIIWGGLRENVSSQRHWASKMTLFTAQIFHAIFWLMRVKLGLYLQ